MTPSREYDFTSSDSPQFETDSLPVTNGAAPRRIRFALALAVFCAVAAPTRALGTDPPTSPTATTVPQSWSAQVVPTDDLSRTIANQDRLRGPTSLGLPVAVAPETTTQLLSVVVVKPVKKKTKQVESPAAVTAAVAQVDTNPPAGSEAGSWAALRKCESGGRYNLNSGNGYYGAYQFAIGTWQRLGFAGYPHEASPAVQDAAAKKLQEKSGWGQWPACSRKLGLY